MIVSILIFERNSPLCKAYSLCIVANFGHFQKLVIFRILGVFWSRFLYRVTLMRSQCRFSHVFFNFIFWAKVTPLQSLSPFHGGQFWPFSKTCHFLNISCFLSRFLHRVTLMRSQCRFSHLFLNFIFLAKVTLFQSL